jgi:hypothetical protein
MAPEAMALKHYLGLELRRFPSRLDGRIIHEEAFPDTSKVNLKVGHAK